LVNALVSAVGKSLGHIVVDAKVQKLEWLVQGYSQGEPNATQQVNELLAAAHLTIDDLMAEVLLAVTDESKSKEINTLTAIERIDRLTTIAETRRNVALREFDRHCAARAQATRQALQQAEDAELIPEQAAPALAPP
jgi:hypothetical protein